MLGLKEISLDFLTGWPVLVWLVMVLLVILSIWLYLRTNPPISRWKKYLLGFLRLVAVLALTGVLLEPVLNYTREFERERQVSILLDRSTSMDRTELDKTRRQRLDSLIDTKAFERLGDKMSVKEYYFGGNLAEVPAEVDSNRTALGEAISELRREQLGAPADYWFVFSDGKSNSGPKPTEAASKLETPIVTVGMAVDVGNFDIALNDVNFNPVVFVGQPTEVQVKIDWHNAANKQFKVELLDDKKVLAENRFPITQEDGRGEVSLKYVPEEPGQKLLKVRIPALEGEETDGNNQETVSVKILKNKLLVLLVSSAPDYEVGFLKRFLDQSDKYEVDFIATGPKAGNLAGSFPSRQTELNRYDLVIFHDPDPVRYESRRELLETYLKERGGAVWVMMGKKFAERGPVAWFDQFLPFYQSARQPLQYIEFHGEPSEDNLFHPVVRLADSRSEIRRLWSEVPPFESVVLCDRIDPEATILVKMTGDSRNRQLPIIGFKRFGPGKLIATAAQPFWTWDFIKLGFGEETGQYANFMEGLITWLTVQDDYDPVRVYPEKEVFNRGEPIRFKGIAYDQGYRPIPAVTGVIQLKQVETGETYEKDILQVAEGRLEVQFDQLPPGTYTYRASLEKNGQVLKKNEGRIQVETFSLEEFDQSGDEQTLTALANQTGGNYYSFRDFDEAVNSLDMAPIIEQEHKEIVLWNKAWLLLIFILALSAEWILRKVNNLI